VYNFIDEFLAEEEELKENRKIEKEFEEAREEYKKALEYNLKMQIEAKFNVVEHKIMTEEKENIIDTFKELPT
jgi:uncharacterized membrane protein (DUF106 family)